MVGTANKLNLKPRLRQRARLASPRSPGSEAWPALSTTSSTATLASFGRPRSARAWASSRIAPFSLRGDPVSCRCRAVTPLSSNVARQGSFVAPFCRREPLLHGFGTLQPSLRSRSAGLCTLATRDPPALLPCPASCPCVSCFSIGSRLFAIRCPLIGIRECSVALRTRPIAVGGGLVGIRRPLIDLRCRLLGIGERLLVPTEARPASVSCRSA